MSAWKLTWAAVVVLSVGSPAFAQPQIGSYQRPQTNSRPTISPYLNLGNSNNPAIDYFGIVQPQMQTQATLQSLQQGLQQVQNTPQQSNEPTNPLDSGHGVTFFNYSHYFPVGGSRFATGTGGVATTPTLGPTRR